MPTRISYVNWILEFVLALFLMIIYTGYNAAVISSDPLTTFPALILRKLGYFRFHYYHSVDYSVGRFKNPIFNSIYKFLLILGLKMADVVGVVTPKAKERLQHYNVKKFVYIPNSPDFHKFNLHRKDIKDRKKNSLVLTCCEISPKFKVFQLLEMVYELSGDFPDVRLNLIGYYDINSEYYKNLLTYIEDHKLNSNVIFHGSVSREENYKIISNQLLGLAFYNVEDNSHVAFGDSLKIREYAALGLVTVSDTATYTSKEMFEAEAGYAVQNFSDALLTVRELLTDTKLYETKSKNALKWASEMDKAGIMDSLAKKYFGI